MSHEMGSICFVLTPMFSLTPEALAARISAEPSIGEAGIAPWFDIDGDGFTRAQLIACKMNKLACTVHLYRDCAEETLKQTCELLVARKLRNIVLWYGLIEEAPQRLELHLFAPLYEQGRLESLCLHGRTCLTAYGYSESDVHEMLNAVPSLARCVQRGQFKRLHGIPCYSDVLKRLCKISPKLAPVEIGFCETSDSEKASVIVTNRFLRWCQDRGIEEGVDTGQLRLGFSNKNTQQ